VCTLVSPATYGFSQLVIIPLAKQLVCTAFFLCSFFPPSFWRPRFPFFFPPAPKTNQAWRTQNTSFISLFSFLCPGPLSFSHNSSSLGSLVPRFFCFPPPTFVLFPPGFFFCVSVVCEVLPPQHLPHLPPPAPHLLSSPRCPPFCFCGLHSPVLFRGMGVLSASCCSLPFLYDFSCSFSHGTLFLLKAVSKKTWLSCSLLIFRRYLRSFLSSVKFYSVCPLPDCLHSSGFGFVFLVGFFFFFFFFPFFSCLFSYLNRGLSVSCPIEQFYLPLVMGNSPTTLLGHQSFYPQPQAQSKFSSGVSLLFPPLYVSSWNSPAMFFSFPRRMDGFISLRSYSRPVLLVNVIGPPSLFTLLAAMGHRPCLSSWLFGSVPGHMFDVVTFFLVICFLVKDFALCFRCDGFIWTGFSASIAFRFLFLSLALFFSIDFT